MNDVLLVGTGPMAVEYGKVLKDMNIPTTVVGRGSASAALFEQATGLRAVAGGIEQWLADHATMPSHVIVAVNENLLGQVALALLDRGAKRLLIEKPGAANAAEIRAVHQSARANNAFVCLGYNRRFYASVAKAREIIKADGGVTSFSFEFTEWNHVIRDLQKQPGVKEQWFLHNSTHVIDLAFFLGGRPEMLAAFTAGGLDWHPAASVFSGAGRTTEKALFSYQANWEAPGRWGVEILTKKHRLIFRPMEKLQIQNLGSVAIEEVPIGNDLDLKFKPGLYRQTEAFLAGDASILCSLQEQTETLPWYEQIVSPAAKAVRK